MFKILRLLPLIFLLSTISVIAQESLLNKEILLDKTEGTVEEILSEIGVKGGFTFSYGNQITLTRRVVIKNKKQSVQNHLNEIFSNKEVEYVTQKNKILLRYLGKKKEQSEHRSDVKSITISGYVRDADTGENLIGSTLFDNATREGVTANSYGFYSLTLKSDSANIICSYVGYQPLTLKLNLQKDTAIVVALKNTMVLDEVVISASRADKIHETTRMGTISMPISQIKKMPALMGEVDVMKVLQLLPGVQSGSEGSTGLYVRGGGADQNLILLDGVPVYNSSHLYGFFSTFNADAINHVELVKGGFPARYGGRLSSVVDISMKEGNQQEIHGQGSIGIIASKFMIEGPIKKGKTSFIVSARRSYLNLLKATIINRSATGPTQNFYFYDVNAKINHKINDRNRIYLSGYIGEDNAANRGNNNLKDSTITYSSKSYAKLAWGNIITALRWNHVLSKNLFANIMATYSRCRLLNENETTVHTITHPDETPGDQYYYYHYTSGIEDYAGRLDFDYIPAPNHHIRFGASVINHTFSPGVLARNSPEANGGQSGNVTTGTGNINANESAGYVEDDWEVMPAIKVNAGMYASAFFAKAKSYSSLQPRFSLRALLSPSMALKASYSSMQQYIHLLTNSGIGLPTDLWVPATTRIKPQTSQQIALGLVRTYQDKFEISVEGFYKTMNNVIEYKDGASYLDATTDWQDKVAVGIGRSYGAELFVQKKVGRLNGWVGYTLSWTNRKFNTINDGRWFPYRYDRRHDSKIALTYSINKRLDVGLTWVYGTGNAITLALDTYSGVGETGYYDMPYYSSDQPVDNFNSRNNFRMRAYHRLDLNAAYVIRKKKIEHKLIVSIYNAYARKNPFYLKFDYSQKYNKQVLVEASLFSILPSITYSIQF